MQVSIKAEPGTGPSGEQEILCSAKTMNTLETIEEGCLSQKQNVLNFDQLTEVENNILHNMNLKKYDSAVQQIHKLIEDLDQISSTTSTSMEMVKQYKVYSCFYNLSVIYNKKKDIPQAEAYLKQSANFLEKMINLSKEKEQEVKLALTIELVRLQLQLCVLMSQNSNHSHAVARCDRIINRIISCFRIMKTTVEETSSKCYRRVNKIGYSIDFRNVVLKQARKKVESLLKIENAEKILSEDPEKMKNKIKKLYSWKQNSENNEKAFKQQFLSECDKAHCQEKRTLLGIAKIPKWAQTFHMGNIMTMQPKQYKFQPNVDPFFLLSENSILELVILLSAAFFTMSTEMRLQEQDKQPKANPVQSLLSMNENKNILKCKILHLKSISIINQFLPFSSKFLSHLITSYNKNYSMYMERITEENTPQLSCIEKEQQRSSSVSPVSKKRKASLGSKSKNKKKPHKQDDKFYF